jgi:cephalosporin hydroxylase
MLSRIKTSIEFRRRRRREGEIMRRAHCIFYGSGTWSNAYWLGEQATKNPLDLWVYQEILTETRPEIVVETGTFRGGSAY